MTRYAVAVLWFVGWFGCIIAVDVLDAVDVIYQRFKQGHSLVTLTVLCAICFALVVVGSIGCVFRAIWLAAERMEDRMLRGGTS